MAMPMPRLSGPEAALPAPLHLHAGRRPCQVCRQLTDRVVSWADGPHRLCSLACARRLRVVLQPQDQPVSRDPQRLPLAAPWEGVGYELWAFEQVRRA